MNIGKLVQVIGPVVDVEFPSGSLPAIYNALKIKLEAAGNGSSSEEHALTTEVSAHLGDRTVRAIAMGPTDGLRRGMPVEDTGAPITVPVGPECLGRLMDVLGDAKDNRGPIKSKETAPI